MNQVPRVLIVEDEPDLRSVYTDALSSDGYQLDTAVDGDDAVQKILQGNWDVILLDIVMPKKNGFDVLETVRRTVIDPAQKQQIMESVIFMTNLDNMTDLTHALSLGPKEYVVKTQVTPGQVQELVRSFLQKKAAQPVAATPAQPAPAANPVPEVAAPVSVQPSQDAQAPVVAASPVSYTLPVVPTEPTVPPMITQAVQQSPASETTSANIQVASVPNVSVSPSQGAPSQEEPPKM